MLLLFSRITAPAKAGQSATIRDTPITVEEVNRELILRTLPETIQAKYPGLEPEDIQAVWFYKAFQDNKDGMIEKQELISLLGSLPERVSLLQLYDHIDFIFMIRRSVSEIAEGKTIPHDQVMREMREYIHGLKEKEKQA